MSSLQRVLFPIDFSDASIAFAPLVRQMAQRFEATLTVLHSFDRVTGYSLAPTFEATGYAEPAPISYTSPLQEMRRDREERLEQFARAQFAGVRHTTRLRDGDPATVIGWEVQRDKTDLVMMPTRGLGRFRRLLLGSIAAKVLHDVSCPVLTSAHQSESPVASPCDYSSIVCAVELSPEMDTVLRMAGLLAQAYRARVCLLHLEGSRDKHHREASVRSLRQAFSEVLNNDEGVNFTVRVLDASIPEGIRLIATEEAADLVIVGRGHQQGTFSRLLSRLYDIVRESPCPVLSV